MGVGSFQGQQKLDDRALSQSIDANAYKPQGPRDELMLAEQSASRAVNIILPLNRVCEAYLP